MTTKKRIYRLLTVVIALCLMSALAVPSFAQKTSWDVSPNVYGVDVLNSGMNVLSNPSRALAECGSYANHDMLAHGWGDIFNINTNQYVVEWGACAQCTRCNLVIITQGEPGGSNALGYYTTWQPGSKLTSQYNIIRQSQSNIFYTSSNRISGIAFRYS